MSAQTVAILGRCKRWATAHSLLVVVLLYVPLAVLYGLVTPIYEGPDEIGHVLYVKHLADGLGIPVQSREYAVGYGFGQEGSQTPLYYALNAGLVRALGLTFDGLDGLPAANPFSTCGRPSDINVAGYRHDPRQEAFPYRGAARAVHAMRLFSAVLGAITVVAVYRATRFAFPQAGSAATLAAAFVAFSPQFAFMGGVVNNDNLVNCLSAIAVALALFALRRRYTWGRTVALGVVCGLAVLAKLGGLMVLAFAAISMLLGMWRQPRRLVLHGILLGGAFLAAAGWWFVRCWRLYGDPTGTNVMLSIYGGRGGWPAHLIIPEILETFRSYWGAFACGLRYPAPLYWAFGLLVVAAVGGWVWGWKDTRHNSRVAATLLFAWVLLVVASWVRWNQITYAPLGRLWFQASAAVGPLLGYGWFQMTRRRGWAGPLVAAGLWVVALCGALLVVRPAFALPERHAASAAPSPPEALPVAVLGDRVMVTGYGLSARSLEPGQVLDVALFFQATQPITDDYALALQLLSPVPGDDATLVNLNTIPGGGNYPTYAWGQDEVIIDRYRLQLPAVVERVQAWRVVAVLYGLDTGERLSVSVANQPAGDILGLGLVRVGASAAPKVPDDVRVEMAPVAGEAIRLEGLALERGGNRLEVRAWWRATAPLGGDYTTLVHLYDGEQGLLAGGDSQPLRGAFPTSMWQPGDLIEDSYTLELQEGVQSLGLGWYDALTGVRLPMSAAGTRLRDDVYLVEGECLGEQ